MSEQEKEKFNGIVDKTLPTINECYQIQKTLGQTPALILQGMVFGFLLARGFTMEESAVGLVYYTSQLDELVKKNPEIEELIEKGTILKVGADGKIKK